MNMDSWGGESGDMEFEKFIEMYVLTCLFIREMYVLTVKGVKDAINFFSTRFLLDLKIFHFPYTMVS